MRVLVVMWVVLVAAGCQCGPPCSATTCTTGCCDQHGECVGGIQDTACGQNGGQCTLCPRGLACVNQVCAAPGTAGVRPCTCITGGCCDRAGNCVAGTSNAACGSGGRTCATCTSTQACLASVCTNVSSGGAGGGGATVCDSTSCANGCCTPGGTCVGPNNQQCGISGSQCLTCSNDTSCIQGICR